jgi:hypothetical protein
MTRLFGRGNTQHSTFNSQHSTFNIQHSTFNIQLQHSTLNIQHSTLNIQHSTFNIQHSTFNIQHSTSTFNFNIQLQHSTFNIQHSTSTFNFNIQLQHSTFNIQHSTFNIQLQHSTFNSQHSTLNIQCPVKAEITNQRSEAGDQMADISSNPETLNCFSAKGRKRRKDPLFLSCSPCSLAAKTQAPSGQLALSLYPVARLSMPMRNGQKPHGAASNDVWEVIRKNTEVHSPITTPSDSQHFRIRNNPPNALVHFVFETLAQSSLLSLVK